MFHIKQFEHLKIQLEVLNSATNNFADENCIGRGGFGKVYKAELDLSEGKTMVALKCLDRRFGQGDPEFWKEIMMLSLYKHKNIVSLLGYCDDCSEKILVYEYLPKRSLELYLNSSELTWVRRLHICIGAAHGLAYLHSADGTQQRVLHRDIKSSNILLDEEWNAKISDFGLSKFGPANQKYTFLISNAVGTPGYWDPLYAETGLLTKESDVYSFGVVLFEVLCGRLCIDNKNNKRPLIGLVRQSYEQNTINEIICDDIKDQIDPDALEVFTKIAHQCLKRNREERPLMTDILKELEKALQCQERVKDPVVNMYIKSGELLESDLSKVVPSVDINEYDPKRGGLLVVTIHEGNNLKVKNPLVMLRVGVDIRRTTTKKNDQNPVWKETFMFPVDKPSNAVLHLVVCSDSWMRTDVVEDIDIRLLDIIKGKQINKIHHLDNGFGRIHVELQWEASALPLKTKPKVLQFMSSFYNLATGVKGQ